MRAVNKWASVVKLLVGVAFIISALSKMVTIDSFEMYVYSFGIFPLVPCFYFSRMLIAAELLLGVGLMSHRYHRLSTITSLLFLVVFIGFLVYAQLIGRTDNCHCFGDLLPFNPVQSILKNAVLIVAILFAYKYAVNEWHPRWWLVCIIFLLTAVLFIFYSIKMLHSLDFYSLVLMCVALAMAILASLPFYSRWWITAPIIIAPFVATFILSPPDNWFHKEGRVRYDKELFLAQLEKMPSDEQESVVPVVDSSMALGGDTTVVTADTVGTLSELDLAKGRHLVAFFSPTCGFCRLSAEKISTLATRKGVDNNKIVYVFPDGFEDGQYEEFYEKAHSCKYVETKIDQTMFVRITRASFPVILLVEDGTIAAAYDYRAVDEGQIGEFLTK